MFALSINERSVKHVTIHVSQNDIFVLKCNIISIQAYYNLSKIKYFVQNVVWYCLQWIFVSSII